MSYPMGLEDNKIVQKNSAHDKIELFMVRNIYEQAKIGFGASFICGTIVLIYLYDAKNDIPLFFWYALFTTVLILRAILVKVFLKQPESTMNIKIWKNLFILGALLSGITWGFAGTAFLLPTHQPLSQAFVLVILAGISAGAVPLNAYIREAAIFFVLATLLPLIFHFLWLALGDMTYALFDVALIVFIVYLLTLIFKTHRLIYHSYQLQFQNDELLEELSTAKKELETTNKRLELAATHDPLTHVANRHFFKALFQDAIDRAARQKQNLALMYLDLDKFKEVNDTYGHHAGDKLLLVVIARIKNVLRINDTVARLGGDEITIILENATHFETVAEIAERICHSIAQPIKVNDSSEVQVYASIGISMYPNDGTGVEELIEVADKAMYFVKENGGNSFHFSLDQA